MKKLFKLRLEMHWTNSHSFLAGYPDVYVMAENMDDAVSKARDQYKEDNKKVAKILFLGEVQEPFIY